MSTLTLYCFPPAGGSAAAYDGWRLALASAVEARSVEYPGHGGRLREQPLASIDDLAADALGQLRPLPGRCAFFGHSMGALVALEVARTVHHRPDVELVRLFVAACAAPAVLADCPAPDPPDTDEEFLSQLAHDPTISARLRAAPDLLRLALPALRADFTACARYRPPAAAPPLPFPVSVLGGRYDPSVGDAELERWLEMSDGPGPLHLLPAGHDLLGEIPTALHHIVATDLGIRSSRRLPVPSPGPTRPGDPTTDSGPPRPAAGEGESLAGAGEGESLAAAAGRDLREQVRGLLSRPDLQAEISRCWTASPDEDAHAPATYRELGARRWLAAHWPPRYGGLGLPLPDAAVVAEEMVLHGVPDTPRVNSIDNAGSILLRGGSDEQRDLFLPPIARGDVEVAVLFSEPEAGSDLAGLQCRAVRRENGWALTGTKIWNAKTARAHYGMCLARTRQASNRYVGLTLFLVQLDLPGVQISRIPALNDEPFYRVDLGGVLVPPGLRIGAEGAAWPLVTAALGMERTGLCYAARARRWLTLLSSELPRAEASHLDVLERDVEIAELLAWDAVAAIDQDSDTVLAPAAKWFASETAARIAHHAVDLLAGSVGLDAEVRAVLDGAARQAPGLTLSAGTSEMMLNAVAAQFADLAGAP